MSIQSAISVLSSLLAFVPDYLDSLANLGIAYLHRFIVLLLFKSYVFICVVYLFNSFFLSFQAYAL